MTWFVTLPVIDEGKIKFIQWPHEFRMESERKEDSYVIKMTLTPHPLKHKDGQP